MEKIHLKGAGLTESWTNQASKCTYCGAIYSTDINGHRKVQGWFEGNQLYTAENWNPHKDSI